MEWNPIILEYKDQFNRKICQSFLMPHRSQGAAATSCCPNNRLCLCLDIWVSSYHLKWIKDSSCPGCRLVVCAFNGSKKRWWLVYSVVKKNFVTVGYVFLCFLYYHFMVVRVLINRWHPGIIWLSFIIGMLWLEWSCQKKKKM